ncbi:MAG: restriction endonuclease subunit S [Magnetococcales bacterium]|nr:restriction endonuclease subunit S [Magnetococcales bacterium]
MKTKWPTVQTQEIFDIARGGSPRPIQNFLTDDPDGINWIMIGDANEGEKYISSTKNTIRKEGERKSRMVHPGDFILTNSMSFGKPCIMKPSGCIHDGWLVLSPHKGKADPDFFYHLLGSGLIYAEFKRMAPGTTVKNLNSDIVKETIISLPPLPEQKRIAAILDKADAIRRKRRQALALADQLLQSAFLRLVGPKHPDYASWPQKTIESLAEAPTSGSTGLI